MTLTNKRSVITAAVVDWLSTWTEGQFGPAKLEAVYYGDPEIISRTPAVSVDPGPMSKELVGAQYITNNEYSCIITIYHGRQGSLPLGQDRQTADEFAESLEDRLHANRTMNDLVIHSFVNLTEPGYVAKGRDVVFVATQLQWYCKTKTRLMP